MSWTICSLILIVAAVAPLILAQDDDRFYSKRYDSIDVDTIFRSSRLLNNYVDCLLDKKPCPPEGKDLKRVLPQALQSKCSRCTKVQKAKALDVITRLYYQHPSIYLSLAERYDPTGEYTRNFEQWYDLESGNRFNSQLQYNEVQQKTRIPSTWITKTTTTTTQRSYPKKSTTSRPTLRTLPPTIRMKVLPTEPAPTERPKTTSAPRTSTARLTTASNVQVIPLDREFTSPPQQQSTQNPPASQFVSQLPLPKQQLATKKVSSTFSTTELPSSIILTNPTTSSFRPIQQSSTTDRPAVSGAGVSTLSAVSQDGSLSTVTTSQIPLSVSTASTPPAQTIPIPSGPVQQVPSTFNTQSTVLTSAFGTPLVQSVNTDIQRQPPSSQLDPNFIDNFFVPRRELIRRSVDQILDTTRGVMRAIFRMY